MNSEYQTPPPPFQTLIFQAENDRKNREKNGYSAWSDFRTHRKRINSTTENVQFLS